MATKKRWGYFAVFVAALLVSGGLHWAWHLFAVGEAEPSAPVQATVSTCLPPFCDKPESSRTQSASTSSSSSAFSPPTVEEGGVARFVPPAAQPVPPAARQAPDGYAIDNATHKICVADLAGPAGAQFAVMYAWQQAALAESDFRPALIPYTNAEAALADLKDGVCQAAWLPGGLDDSVLPALNTLEAFGAVPTIKHARILMQVLLAGAQPVDKLRSNEDYTLMGLTFPGPAYLIFNRRADGYTLESQLRGKRVATIGKAQAAFAQTMGAKAVSADPANVGTKLNSGAVDAMFATTDMLEQLELIPAMQRDGVLYAVPMYQASRVLVARKAAFSQEQMRWSRDYFANTTEARQDKQAEAEKGILATVGQVQPASAERRGLEESLRRLRLALREQGIYNAELLRLERKVRCKLEPGLDECVRPVE